MESLFVFLEMLFMHILFFKYKPMSVTDSRTCFVVEKFLESFVYGIVITFPYVWAPGITDYNALWVMRLAEFLIYIVATTYVDFLDVPSLFSNFIEIHNWDKCSAIQLRLIMHILLIAGLIASYNILL